MEKRDEKQPHDLPKTWSVDHGGGVVPPSRADENREKRRDEGIRPEELDSENDQGAG